MLCFGDLFYFRIRRQPPAIRKNFIKLLKFNYLIIYMYNALKSDHLYSL